MPTYDFDFQRYVERRKGAREAEHREGASYAYAGDVRIRKLLARARPVQLALEATVRLWRATARAELLGTARRATELDFSRVHRLARQAAERLHVAPPVVYLSPLGSLTVGTFGTDDEAQVLLHAGLADTLSDVQLLFALGAECGRIQNNHVLLQTARHSLQGASSRFVRWIVGPAVYSLDAWARRAVVTADRAGLLACRDLEAARTAMAACVSAGEAYAPRAKAPTAAHNQPADGTAGQGESGLSVAQRIDALEVFARGAYYRGALGETGGLSPEETDKQTTRALKGAQ